jgi:hypothetical protein
MASSRPGRPFGDPFEDVHRTFDRVVQSFFDNDPFTGSDFRLGMPLHNVRQFYIFHIASTMKPAKQPRRVIAL